MERSRFGSTGVDVPVIGQGTWYIDRGHRPGAVEALRRGLDLGLTHIDTAEMYGDAEVIVGEAIAGRREEVFLVSKVVPQHASRRGTLQACEQSLARLRTDHLDCYLLHWPGPHPLDETFDAFEALRQAGKIRAWGVSNFDVPNLQGALRAMGAARGEGRLACNQVLYHLEERAIEHAVLPWCERNEVAVVGYSPFGHDSFPDPQTPGGRVLRRSPPPTGRLRAWWRCASWRVARRCSPSPKPPARRPWRRTRGPATCTRRKPTWPASTPPFPLGPGAGACRCFSHE